MLGLFWESQYVLHLEEGVCFVLFCFSFSPSLPLPPHSRSGGRCHISQGSTRSGLGLGPDGGDMQKEVAKISQRLTVCLCCAWRGKPDSHWHCRRNGEYSTVERATAHLLDCVEQSGREIANKTDSNLCLLKDLLACTISTALILLF